MYGSKFRFKPDGILFNTPNADRDIYGMKSNVMRTLPYTASQRSADHASTMNAIDVELHAKKRKLLNLVFTKKSVNDAGAFIEKHVDRWNELLVHGGEKDWSEPSKFVFLS